MFHSAGNSLQISSVGLRTRYDDWTQVYYCYKIIANGGWCVENNHALDALYSGCFSPNCWDVLQGDFESSIESCLIVMPLSNCGHGT